MRTPRIPAKFEAEVGAVEAFSLVGSEGGFTLKVKGWQTKNGEWAGSEWVEVVANLKLDAYQMLSLASELRKAMAQAHATLDAITAAMEGR